LERGGFITVLTAFFSAHHDDTARPMSQSDAALTAVYVLPTGTAGSKRIDVTLRK
jgi:hypothetical protein